MTDHETTDLAGAAWRAREDEPAEVPDRDHDRPREAPDVPWIHQLFTDLFGQTRDDVF